MSTKTQLNRRSFLPSTARVASWVAAVSASALLAWSSVAQDNATGSGVGKVTSHSQGLHGYIGFGHEKLPPAGDYTAGMGFYAAVWPLVEQPLADFQIGLPGSRSTNAQKSPSPNEAVR